MGRPTDVCALHFCINSKHLRGSTASYFNEEILPDNSLTLAAWDSILLYLEHIRHESLVLFFDSMHVGLTLSMCGGQFTKQYSWVFRSELLNCLDDTWGICSRLLRVGLIQRASRTVGALDLTLTHSARLTLTADYLIKVKCSGKFKFNFVFTQPIWW